MEVNSSKTIKKKYMLIEKQTSYWPSIDSSFNLFGGSDIIYS